ncbi:hypothetical protein [Ahrensia sp. R2A130]|uniref:hypothetical protein n=1 Tax=Ahrensia sp. R2A130 TaxID=744979 RepID=UPI0001E0E121|nr:hypothetical protein [Ahrensia sp. R2A130]EFL87568.1 putative lipoprotein [Ahrensia sp. R2A130]
MISQRFFASLIGVIAFGLPTFLVFGSLVGGCFRNSLSHNYYSSFFGDVFVVSLAAMGLFLFAYRGRDGRGGLEDKLATVAGIAALGVALFPTEGDGLDGKACASRAFVDSVGGVSFELFANVWMLHVAAAVYVFGFLAYYALFNFTKVHSAESVDAHGNLTPAKRHRNRLYRASGIAILGCIALLGLHSWIGHGWTFWHAINATFWIEALALVAFGTSWIVRGRVFDTVLLDSAAKGVVRLTSKVSN